MDTHDTELTFLASECAATSIWVAASSMRHASCAAVCTPRQRPATAAACPTALASWAASLVCEVVAAILHGKIAGRVLSDEGPFA